MPETRIKLSDNSLLNDKLSLAHANEREDSQKVTEVKPVLYGSFKLSQILQKENELTHSYRLLDITQSEFSSELLHSLLSITPVKIKKSELTQVQPSIIGGNFLFSVQYLTHTIASLYFNSPIPLSHFLSTIHTHHLSNLESNPELFQNTIDNKSTKIRLTSDHSNATPIYILQSDTAELFSILSAHPYHFYRIHTNNHNFIFYFHESNLYIIDSKSDTCPLIIPKQASIMTWLAHTLTPSSSKHIIGKLDIHPFIHSHKNEQLLMSKLENLFLKTCRNHHDIALDHFKSSVLHWLVSITNPTYNIPLLLNAYLNSIEGKFNINSQNYDNYTIFLLLYEYSTNTLPILSLLLDYDKNKEANFNLLNKSQSILLHFLFKYSDLPSPDLELILRHDIHQQINLNCQDHTGWSPIMILIRYSDHVLPCLKLILKHDQQGSLNFNLVNNQGWSALMLGTRFLDKASIKEIFELILTHNPSKKIDINLTVNGVTLIMFLIHFKHSKEVIELVLNYSPTIDLSIEYNGNTALMMAQNCKADPEIIELLSEKEKAPYHSFNESEILIPNNSKRIQLLDMAKLQFSPKLLQDLLSIQPVSMKNLATDLIQFPEFITNPVEDFCDGFVTCYVINAIASLHFHSTMPLTYFLSAISDNSPLSLDKKSEVLQNIITKQRRPNLLIPTNLKSEPIYFFPEDIDKFFTILSEHPFYFYKIEMNLHTFAFYFHIDHLCIININSDSCPLIIPLFGRIADYLSNLLMQLLGYTSSTSQPMIGKLTTYPFFNNQSDENTLMGKLEKLFLNTCDHYKTIIFDNHHYNLLHFMVTMVDSNPNILFLTKTYLNSTTEKIDLNSTTNYLDSILIPLYIFSVNTLPMLSFLLEFDKEKAINFNLMTYKNKGLLHFLFANSIHPSLNLKAILDHQPTQKINLNHQDDGGNSPVIVLIEHNNQYMLTCLHLMLKYDPELNLTSRNNNGYNPLMIAAKDLQSSDIIELFKIILTRNPSTIDFNYQSHLEGWSLISLLIRYSKYVLPCLKLILENDTQKSIDFNLVNNQGWSALMLGARFLDKASIKEIFELILTHNPSKKIDINLKLNGVTLIMFLIHFKHSKEVIELVLNYSPTIDLSIQYNGDTALMMAKKYKADPEIIELLSEREKKQLFLEELPFYESLITEQ